MEDLLSRILVLAPIAGLIFIRFFSAAAKRRQQAKQGAEQGRSQPTDSWLGRLVKGILEVEEPGKQPGAGASARPPLLHYEEEAMQNRPPVKARPAAPRGETVRPEARTLAMTATPAVTRHAGLRPRREPPRAGGRAAGRLASLPELQRAIILSEVLGRPRSLNQHQPYGDQI